MQLGVSSVPSHSELKCSTLDRFFLNLLLPETFSVKQRKAGTEEQPDPDDVEGGNHLVLLPMILCMSVAPSTTIGDSETRRCLQSLALKIDPYRSLPLPIINY